VTERHPVAAPRWRGAAARLGAASILVTGWVGVSPLAAQTAPQASSQAATGTELTLRASVDAGYDDNVVADAQVGANNPRMQASGSHQGGTLGLTYLIQRPRIDFGGSIGSAFRWYQAPNRLMTHGYNAGAGFGATLSPRMRLQGTFSGSYSPQYQFSVLPQVGQTEIGQIPGPVLDYGLTMTDMVVYQAGAQFSYAPGRRTSLSLMSNVSKTNFGGRHLDLRTREFGGRFQHGLTRNASLNLGYVLVEGQWPGGTVTQTTRNHNIDVGIDYNRALTFSRNTKISFGFGSGAIDDGARTYYNVRGHASLTHEMSRTWTVDAAYRRGLSLIAGFGQPFFADSFGVNIGGALTRRLSVSGSGGYSIGDVGLGQVGRGYDSYTARANAQFSFTKWLSGYGEYLYYHYRFSDDTVLPLNAAQGLNRQGARVGLDVLVPLKSQRRPVAAR